MSKPLGTNVNRTIARLASNDIRNMLFLFSDNPWFPTWWSKLPSHAPVLVGWSAGPRAQQFSVGSRHQLLRVKQWRPWREFWDQAPNE